MREKASVKYVSEDAEIQASAAGGRVQGSFAGAEAYEGYRQGNGKSVRGTLVVEFLFPAGYTVKRNPSQRGLIYAAA